MEGYIIGRTESSLQVLPKDSPLGRLGGSNNLVKFLFNSFYLFIFMIFYFLFIQGTFLKTVSISNIQLVIYLRKNYTCIPQASDNYTNYTNILIKQHDHQPLLVANGKLLSGRPCLTTLVAYAFKLSLNTLLWEYKI